MQEFVDEIIEYLDGKFNADTNIFFMSNMFLIFLLLWGKYKYFFQIKQL